MPLSIFELRCFTIEDTPGLLCVECESVRVCMHVCVCVCVRGGTGGSNLRTENERCSHTKLLRIATNVDSPIDLNFVCLISIIL